MHGGGGGDRDPWLFGAAPVSERKGESWQQMKKRAPEQKPWWAARWDFPRHAAPPQKRDTLFAGRRERDILEREEGVGVCEGVGCVDVEEEEFRQPHSCCCAGELWCSS